MERIKPHNGHYLFFLSNYGNNGGKEGRLWHNVGRKPHYMAIFCGTPAVLFVDPKMDRPSKHPLPKADRGEDVNMVLI